MVEYEAYHGNDVWIETTDEQKDAAIRVGLAMQKFCSDRGMRHRLRWYSPDERKSQRIHALGELCQMITCVGLGRAITHRPQTWGEPDLLPDIQVRLIGKEHYGLRVNEEDKDHWRVVGVVVPKGREREPKHRCPGWIHVYEARRHPEWFIEPYGPPPVCCVPQERLRHFDDMRASEWDWF